MLKNIDGNVSMSGTTPHILTDLTVLIGATYRLMVVDDGCPVETANKMLTNALFLGIEAGKKMVKEDCNDNREDN